MWDPRRVIPTFEDTDGRLRRRDDAASLNEASARLPPGVYTTLRVYPGRRVPRLDLHLARLQTADAPLDRDRVVRVLADVLDQTSLAECRVRVAHAGGRLFVAVEPFTGYPGRLYATGVRAVTLGLERHDPAVKDTRFIATAAAAARALPDGIHEGLLVAPDGSLLEGLTSNVFAVKDDVLRTEERRVLPGVSRSMVLDLADGVLPVERRAVTTADVPHLAEVFLTSVSREVLPVVEVDGHRIGDGAPGPAARELLRRFRALVAREGSALA